MGRGLPCCSLRLVHLIGRHASKQLDTAFAETLRFCEEARGCLPSTAHSSITYYSQSRVGDRRVTVRWLHLTVVECFAAVTIIFAVQNLEIVSVDFLSLGVRIPLAFLVVAVYLVGMATGGSVLALLRRSVREAGLGPVEIHRELMMAAPR
jgi:lipopolysaccharide assembly protein A